MSVSVAPMSGVGDMVDNYTDDASALAARTAVLAQHTMNTANGMRPLPSPVTSASFDSTQWKVESDSCFSVHTHTHKKAVCSSRIHIESRRIGTRQISPLSGE